MRKKEVDVANADHIVNNENLMSRNRILLGERD
jgi:hypothetical protein